MLNRSRSRQLRSDGKAQPPMGKGRLELASAETSRRLTGSTSAEAVLDAVGRATGVLGGAGSATDRVTLARVENGTVTAVSVSDRGLAAAPYSAESHPA